MTEAGLNTVNLSEMTTFQQIILFLLIIIGSTIFVSVGTVWTRKRVFEKRFKGIVKSVREGKRRGNGGLLGGNDGVREVGVGERLEEQRKEREGGDERVFESRHSGPRDPTQLPLSTRSRDLVETRSLAGDSKMNGNLNPGSGTGTGGRGVGEEGKEDVEMQGLENSHSRTRTGARSRSQGTGTGAEDRDHISTKRHSASSQDPGFSTGITPEPPHRLLSFVGVDAHRHTLNAGSASAYSHPQHAHSTLIHRTEKPSEGIENTTGADHSGVELDQAMYPHYLTRRTTGRNAQFHGLTREEREHLGGVEYRAITLLGWVVPVYFVAWQVLGCVGLGAYNKINKEEVIRANGINPCYPLILRLILWLMLKILTLIYPDPLAHSTHKATLRFILTYPRRVYTNLFPAAPTLWLLFMVITLNGIDWIAFELLNIGNLAVEAIPARFRVLDGLFQAIAVRSGGFYIIGISELRIGLQVLYVLMMYISVYPVVITMRHSNVYEERSLGIYAEDASSLFSSDDSDEENRIENPHNDSLVSERSKPHGKMASFLHTISSLARTQTPASHTRTQFIRQQIRGQLAHDIWLLVLAVLVISCIEVANFEADPVTFSVFNIIFEVMSGYGCVGISTGMKGEAYSFSGGWSKASKVVLCGVMLRGRHRGLPVKMDRAVRLPGWDEDEGEEGKEG
ncbi:related to potassium transport protein TRK1, high-affinity [Rhynchosporium graminicola]|uniref:Related to potassium transport protein TRK1, high-affinity n=1 Tax=Rhynchosporium graminicola TaxID=2792576 RepID=A0A1E1L7W0_9HELO|nr:related to potassium transport protein TRK1, high-affinity [Rhynchosporium commune]